MKKSRLLGAVCACAVGIVTSHATFASPVTVTNNFVEAKALDASLSTDSSLPTTIPYTDTLTAMQGNSSNITNINYSGDASSVTFTYDFTHSIDSTVGDTNLIDFARTQNISLRFTANSNSTYSIDGFYAMSGTGEPKTSFNVALRDLTTSTTLLDDFTESQNSANASFILGVIGDGDFGDSIIGSLTGNLVAGHNYQFIMSAYIQANVNNTTAAASASGEVNLNIGAVPIPAAIWLFGSGLLGLVGMARRKKT